MAIFDQVTVVGLGLMGGSLGQAIRRGRLARRVVGVSRKSSTLRAAKRIGAIDEGTTDLAAACRTASLIVLATPVDLIVPQARLAAAPAPAGCIITDLGSTKSKIVAALERGLPRGVSFVGSHPLTGSEQRGIVAAKPDLYRDATCVVAVTKRTPAAAKQRVARLWRALGSRVVTMDPRVHDRLLAEVSHLPHVVAFAMMAAVSQQALALAPRSFRDATRVAASDPDLWDDILLSNRGPILQTLARFEHRCAELRRLMQRNDRQRLRRLLRHAQAIRQRLDG